jgi:hypothetical protein
MVGCRRVIQFVRCVGLGIFQYICAVSSLTIQREPQGGHKARIYGCSTLGRRQDTDKATAAAHSSPASTSPPMGVLPLIFESVQGVQCMCAFLPFVAIV